MAVHRITRSGSNLIVHMDDGSRMLAFRGASSVWFPTKPGGPGPDPDPDPGGDDPKTFNMRSNDGALNFTIQEQGMKYARIIYDVGTELGLPREGIVAAFMCVMVESPPFLMLANSNVPESLNYPHDEVGSDNYSLGLFQQQSMWGWGTTAQLMDAAHNAKAFFGGPTGPNFPSPAGLLDLSNPTWDNRATLGTAVQDVQGSAYPTRYDNWTEACFALYDAMGTAGGGGSFRSPFVIAPSPDGDLPPVGSGDSPLAEFGPRTLTGNFHEGIDFGYRNATNGAVIHAAGDGVVKINGPYLGYGNCFAINHGSYEGKEIVTLYGHRQANVGPAVGSKVSKWDEIGLVGSTGNVTGPHLHWETHITDGGNLIHDNLNGSYDSPRTAIDPREFMKKYGE